LTLLLLLFTVVPAIEIGLFVVVGGKLGLLNTLAVVLLVGVAGAALARAEGARVLLEIRDALAAGRMPTRELAEGALVVAAGALLLTPGFFTDILALLLLIPGSRHIAMALLMRWFEGRLQAGVAAGAAGGGQGQAGGGPWIISIGNPRPGPMAGPDADGDGPPTLDAAFEVKSDGDEPRR
jgi:UPF0716 protein FxsA